MAIVDYQNLTYFDRLLPPSGKPLILMSVSIGWAIRNFFQTGIVERLKQRFEVIILATPKASRNLAQLGFDQSTTILSVDVGIEPISWKLFRQIKKKIYLEGRNSSTEAIWEKYRPRPRYQRIGGQILKSLLHFSNAQRLYNWTEWLDLRVNSDRRLADTIQRFGPILYFATHATSYYEECLLRNALAAHIPSVFMILSWDHLSSKILLNQNLHSVFVWNNHTKQEILKTYPCYRSEQIKVVGIPQYDLYAEKPTISYESWCRKYGLTSSRRTVLFSTMPQSRHEQQHVILEEMLKAIVAGQKLPSDLQVLIKCHPFDSFEGYDTLLRGYPVGIHRSHFGNLEKQEDWIPLAYEIEASRDALYFCSVNINIFSTVTIEAAYFDKPVIHIAFDPHPVEGRIPCHEYYNWDHFKPIIQKGSSIMVHNFEELFEGIRRSLSEPDRYASQRKNLVDCYIGRNIGEASTTVVQQLADIAENLVANR